MRGKTNYGEEGMDHLDGCPSSSGLYCSLADVTFSLSAFWMATLSLIITNLTCSPTDFSTNLWKDHVLVTPQGRITQFVVIGMNAWYALY